MMRGKEREKDDACTRLPANSCIDDVPICQRKRLRIESSPWVFEPEPDPPPNNSPAPCPCDPHR